MQWMSKCQCVDNRQPQKYPTRLVSLQDLKRQDYFHTRKLESTIQFTETEVRLVETSEWEHGRPPQADVRYVTLSHCWGNAANINARLTSKNIDTFKRGIKLEALPKTFRDAIEFAARLPHVGYIWIDSLCIKQGDTADWLAQSATMDYVYRESFLNLSATASTSSEGGLFFSRRPELLLEDEIVLNIAGLPGANAPPSTLTALQAVISQPIKKSDSILDMLRASWLIKFLLRFGLLRRLIRLVFTRTRNNTQDILATTPNLQPSTSSASEKSLPEYGEELKKKDLRRCTILDVSFWSDRVDGAPVNTRGWVLQERLMAPRVLHFCRDQIAWECHEFEAAEGQPATIPNFQLTIDGIREGSRLKGLDIVKDGSWLRRMRLNEYEEPDPHLQPGIYTLELWRRIVEVYSNTAVTNPEDKLIALSGMARWMSRQIEEISRSPADSKIKITGSEQYVAGLWTVHLASQLLWLVEPVFREIDSEFMYFTTAPKRYRAPSWSWASIDAHKGNGIKYAEITDTDLLISIEDVSIAPSKGSDEFGLLDDAHMTIWGKLRKAVISEKAKGRFGWRLVEREGLNEEEHTIMYLDCPERDRSRIMGHMADIFVVPAARGERTAPESSKYLTCLILQLDKNHKKGVVFRRVGVTKLSPYADHNALDKLKILEAYPSDISMPHRGYDPETGMHRIMIV